LFLSICDSCSPTDFKLFKDRLKQQITVWQSSSKFNKLNEKKKVKKIYEDVHKTFLEKYEINHELADVFRSGKYNCVSASALYGLFFNALDIPVSVKESYDHVYLVAYPTSLSIRVESTDPMKGYYVYDDRAKAQFAEFLKNAKLISEEEYEQKSVDKLFNEHYYREDEISLKELAGLQYYNKSLKLYDAKKYEEAYAMAEKSYFLYPSDRSALILVATMSHIMNSCQYNDLHYAAYIYKASRYTKFGVLTDNVVNQFKDVTNKLLMSDYNTNRYDAYFKEISAHLEDSALVDEIAFIYYFERGRILYNDGKFDSSLVFIEQAFNLKPRHVDTRILFTDNLLKAVYGLDEPGDALSELNKYAEIYPSLLENNDFRDLKCTLILVMGIEQFMENNFQDAFGYIDEFEETANSFSAVFESYQINRVIEEAYSRAASYYFRKGKYAEAKAYINKGLVYAPQSFELKNKLRSIPR